MTNIASQIEAWYTAAQLAEAFPHTIGRLDSLGLHKLGVRASMVARSQGITPRQVEAEHHRYRAVQVSAYPMSAWRQAHNQNFPAGLEPKPTTFNGAQFRSRAEARTAVWLTSMGYRWDYEPQSYELSSGWYLPDFRVMLDGDWTWLEIKGQHALLERRDPRWSQLVRKTYCPFVVMYGLWRPVPFKDSGPARMFRGETSDRLQVHWSEMTSLFPEGAASSLERKRLERAYRDAADERFGDDDGLSFAA